MNGNKKSADSFFHQLRKLASTVEHLVEDYKLAVNDKTNHEFCAPQVCKTISDMRNGMKQLKVVAQQELDEVNKSIHMLDDILSAGNNYLSTLKLEETEQYLGHYGFKSYDEVYGTKQAKAEDKEINESREDIEEEDETSVAERPQTPPRAMAPPKDLNRTPQLEDFGLSEVTLQIMNSVQKAKPPETKPSVPRPEWSSVPSIFHHDGIICTPSLTRSLNPNSSYSNDFHAALASPTNFSAMSEMPTIQETDSNPSSANPSKLANDQRSQDVKKNLSGMELYSESAPVSNKRTVSVGLFQSVEKKGTVTKSNQSPVEPYSQAHGFDYMEPSEPDFTYSLEALSEMTGVFKINPVMKPPTTTVKPYTPLPVNDDKENATPPEPKLLTEQVSRFKSNLPKTDKIPDIDVKKYMCDDMPPSPKLLGNYDYLK